MIVSWNFYYALPGKTEAVLQQRIRASDVREQLDLPRGCTISKIGGSEHWPDTAWRLDFADLTTQDADMKVRADSPAFESIRTGMRRLYRRFERPLYAPCRKGDAIPATVNAGQDLMIYGLYCAETTCIAMRTVLHDLPAIQFISGGVDVPRVIIETGEAGMPSALLAQLNCLPLRIERSRCRVVDSGRSTID